MVRFWDRFSFVGFGVWLQLLSAWPNNYVVSLYGNQSEMLYVSRSTATTTNAVTATISQ